MNVTASGWWSSRESSMTSVVKAITRNHQNKTFKQNILFEF